MIGFKKKGRTASQKIQTCRLLKVPLLLHRGTLQWCLRGCILDTVERERLSGTSFFTLPKAETSTEDMQHL